MDDAGPAHDPQPAAGHPLEVDVLIVGAGISGIGAACHLEMQCRWASYVVLEAFDSFGGTWLTHQYPGVRSDSDLHTFGYRFKPWVGPPIASGDQIQSYLASIIEQFGLAPKINYGSRVERASWDSHQARWFISARDRDGRWRHISARFLWLCSGYYNHAEGYTPEWLGREDFGGQIVHPQHWPQDLDHAGKKVLVIGSGATAATLVPALADKAAHVTLLQRSPTYFFPRPNVNELAEQLRALDIDPAWIHEIVRRQTLQTQQQMVERACQAPETVKSELIAAARAYLGPDYDVETHFTPRYRPWQQRIALLPDGDLFKGIASGKASVVTDSIDRFTREGIRLTSGQVLAADIIVTATGFNLLVGGGIKFDLDGEPLELTDHVTYRGMMWEGVPNLAWIMGYFRASWTLRVDLLGDFICRLLNHMRQGGSARVTPRMRPEEAKLPRLAWVDPDDFNPGYLQRGAAKLSPRLAAPDWRHTQDYWSERADLPSIDFAQSPLEFAARPSADTSPLVAASPA